MASIAKYTSRTSDALLSIQTEGHVYSGDSSCVSIRQVKQSYRHNFMIYYILEEENDTGLGSRNQPRGTEAGTG
jgi:hypothetical protein